jgi:hypothetical protein
MAATSNPERAPAERSANLRAAGVIYVGYRRGPGK